MVKLFQNESYLKVFEFIEVIKDSLIENQELLVVFFNDLIRSGENLGKESSIRRLKIVMNYLKIFYQDKLIQPASLKQIFEYFSQHYPPSNKIYKEINESVNSLLRTI